MVQLRTNLFFLPHLKMLHIPSSPTENTADIFLSTSPWLSSSFHLGLSFSLSFRTFGWAFISLLNFTVLWCHLVTYCYKFTRRTISVPQWFFQPLADVWTADYFLRLFHASWVKKKTKKDTKKVLFWAEPWPESPILPLSWSRKQHVFIFKVNYSLSAPEYRSLHKRVRERGLGLG